MWTWNWTWNCDGDTAPPAPAPPAGSTVWVWNWQWDCGEGAAPPTPSVPTVCVACNVALSIRVLSPGDDGDVTQSIVSEAQSSVVQQTPPAVGPSAVAAVTPPVSFVPFGVPSVLRVLLQLPLPPPVVVAEPLPPQGGADGLRTLLEAGQGPGSGMGPPDPGAADLPGFHSEASVFGTAHTIGRHRAGAHVRETTSRTSSFAFAEATVSTHVVIAQTQHRAGRERSRTERPEAAATAPSTPLPPAAPPRAPAPAAAASSSSGSHGFGGGVVAAALAGAAGLALLAVLSGILPTSAFARRRLSDDRRNAPG